MCYHRNASYHFLWQNISGARGQSIDYLLFVLFLIEANVSWLESESLLLYDFMNKGKVNISQQAEVNLTAWEAIT